MSYVEAAFIKRSQYDTLEPDRLQGEEMEAGELYVAMFALPDNPKKREAAKLPVEFRDLVQLDDIRWMASLAVLSTKGEPAKECVGEFTDGYWSDVDVRLRVVDLSNGYRHVPEEGYVRTYDPHLDADLRLVHDRLAVPA